MNSFLPNIRWLALPSENLGLDWYEKSFEIDSILAPEGLDLESEKTFLLFSDSPEKILAGVGHCLIARSVIGPKKTMKAPLVQTDWVAAPVWREKVEGDTLHDILLSCKTKREMIQDKLRNDFFLCVTRSLGPDLKLSVELISHQ